MNKTYKLCLCAGLVFVASSALAKPNTWGSLEFKMTPQYDSDMQQPAVAQKKKYDVQCHLSYVDPNVGKIWVQVSGPQSQYFDLSTNLKKNIEFKNVMPANGELSISMQWRDIDHTQPGISVIDCDYQGNS